VINISKAAKDELIRGRGIKFEPGLTSNQTFRQLLVMDEPPSLKEVKILRPLRTRIEDLFWYVK
jgi:hypothetical protein